MALEDLEKKLYKQEKPKKDDFLINLQKKKKILEESSEALEKPLEWKRADEIILSNAAVSVFLPEGAMVLGSDLNKRVITKEIGELEANAGFNEKISIIIFGTPSQAAQTSKKFDASISYASALSARFEKSGSVEISVYESAIKLDLISPEKVLNC